jgi:hypothetical protein
MCGATSVFVHEGFNDAYESVRPQLAAVFKKLVHDGAGGYDVVVAGHSLGAALATLAAVDLVCGDNGIESNSVWGKVSMYVQLLCHAPQPHCFCTMRCALIHYWSVMVST